MNYEKISPKKKTDSGGHKTYAHSVPKFSVWGIFFTLIICIFTVISGVPGYSSHVQAGGLADSISEREAEAQKDETSGGGLSDIVQSFADAGEEAGLEDVADSAEEPLTESSATYAEWHTSEPLVVDNADLWTDREESELAERADELSREYGIVLV